MVKEKKIKEIFVCSSVFHLFQSLYIGENITNEKILIYIDVSSKKVPFKVFSDNFKEIIYIRNYKNDFVLSKLFSKLLYEGRLFNFSKLGKICNEKNVKFNVYVFNDFQPTTTKIIQKTKKNKNSIKLVEEGLMTYSTNQYWLQIQHHKILNKILGIQVENTCRHNHAIDTIMCRNPEKLPLIKTQGRKIVKINNLFLDKKWVNKMIDLLNIDFSFNYENTAIWLGQPLAKDSILNDDLQEIEFVKEIVQTFKGKYHLVIKTHPRDLLIKYKDLLKMEGISIIDLGDKNWIPAELIFQKIKPKLILTPFSSAADFFLEINNDTKIIYCAKAMGIKLDNESINCLKGRNKYLPENIKEIKTIIFNDD